MSKEDTGKQLILKNITTIRPIPNEFILKAMDEWADIKVGEAIAGASSVSHEYEIPKIILDTYAEKTYNQAIDDAMGVVKSNFPNSYPLVYKETIKKLQSLKK